jgi:hypothetical protein
LRVSTAPESGLNAFAEAAVKKRGEECDGEGYELVGVV